MDSKFITLTKIVNGDVNEAVEIIKQVIIKISENFKK